MIKIGKNISNFSTHSCQPKTREELQEIVDDRIFNKYGPDCDLNDIDTSLITDMSYVFYRTEFNGDISEWDVSNVTNMSYMFFDSDFRGDISKWNVKNVTNMLGMFYYCESFIKDISSWNVSNVKIMYNMFYKCPIDEKRKPKFI